jgi:hypothetical protein
MAIQLPNPTQEITSISPPYWASNRIIRCMKKGHLFQYTPLDDLESLGYSICVLLTGMTFYNCPNVPVLCNKL